GPMSCGEQFELPADVRCTQRALFFWAGGRKKSGARRMKFYKYWAKGTATVADVHPWNVRAFGGSDVSMQEALQRANERAGRVAAALVNGQAPGSYGYDERPLREEIIEEIRDGGKLVALITRNAYGSLVLNTNRVMFVDVDVYPPTMSFGEALRHFWRSLTG